MQSDYREICKITSSRTGKSEQLYRDLSNFIFADLAKNIRRPKTLIIKLKGIGFWFLRKKKILDYIKFPPHYDKKREDFTHDILWNANEQRKELFVLFAERLKEYDKFLEKKSKIKSIRQKTQNIVIPDDNSEE